MKTQGVPRSTGLSNTIGDNYKLYSLCWHQLESAGAKEGWSLFEKMQAISKWALTAVATTRREAEMLAAIVYADATDSAGDLLEQPTAA
jgi:hypothetical protein